MNITNNTDKINNNYTKEELYKTVQLISQLEKGEKSLEEYKNVMDHECNKFIKSVLSRCLVYYLAKREMDLPEWATSYIENENIDIFNGNKANDIKDYTRDRIIETICGLEIREIRLSDYKDMIDHASTNLERNSLKAYIPHFVREKEKLPEWFNLDKCLEIDFLNDVTTPIKILLIANGIIFNSYKAAYHFSNTTFEYKLKIIDIMIKTNRYPSDSKIQSLIIDEVEKNKRFIDKELYNQVMNSMPISNNSTPNI